MRRREFAKLVAVMVSWPMVANAQKPMPVIGFFGAFPSSASAQIELELTAFREGLKETGYVEGQNVVIEYRRGEGRFDRLPALAGDLVNHKVDVIVTQGGDAASFAAKNATSTIPIVFHTGSDPIAIGLVSSLARPNGNLTGVGYLSIELMPKLLELLLDAVPQARVIGLMVDADPPETERIIEAVQSTASAKQMDVISLKVRTEDDVDRAFATLLQRKADGLVVQSRFRRQIAAQALRDVVPTIAQPRDFADNGGLLSYGPSLTDIYRLKGIYAGKILKGANPADLPVQQPTKFELVINIKTAQALGLAVPQLLLARADEVIE